MRLKYCAELVKEAFILDNVRLFGDPEFKVRRVAIAPGSGADMIPYAIKAGAQLLITGDISHHKGIDAVAEGLNIIDAGHYGIEKIFVSYMKDFFRKQLPEMNVSAASQKEPFVVI
jgi:putative NIF3 family GTP cyclohydrolase 1 type 2